MEGRNGQLALHQWLDVEDRPARPAPAKPPVEAKQRIDELAWWGRQKDKSMGGRPRQCYSWGQVLDQYDDDARWLMTVAENERLHGKLESALSSLDHVIRLEPNNNKAKTMRAKVLKMKSKTGTDGP